MTNQSALHDTLQKLENAAKEATPGTRTVRDDNEGMEPQFGQMWVVENEDNKTEDEYAIPLECAVYYGCKADADLVALCDPTTILQLTSALRLTLDALESLHFYHCTACEENMAVRDEALASIQQLGLGEGGK